MTATLYLGNDNLVEIANLRDASAATGVYLNGATCSCTLKDPSGDTVAGPTSMEYVSGSNGKYQALIADTVPLVAGRIYTAQITADDGAGKRGAWELETVAKARTS